MPSKRLPNAVTQEQQTAFRRMLDALVERGVGRHEIATRCRASRGQHLSRCPCRAGPLPDPRPARRSSTS